ncbi:hypothetical protein [Methylobacillus sp.]|uniref:hypothetical protein n=1 Tax=Methylobacillus sp. TaxID=56818 RepID=UPI0012D08476|nr:hypothetical protein [Methylobacillus sp.]MPS48537.1 hypothetical protein [Methylobacillus sp.]
MEPTLIDYLIVFASNFAGIFLLGLQSKNVQNSRYIPAVITSMLISVTQVVFVKYMSQGDLAIFGVAAVGSALGIASSIWFYQAVWGKHD